MYSVAGLADDLVDICARAAEAILEVYHQVDFDVDIKADDSPVTKADLAASRVIEDALKSLTPDIPIVCEELPLPPFAERKNWPRYWLVDPLDGTKEFIRRNDQFTVNIALIEGGRASVGVVYVPVTKLAYVGIKDLGAYKIDGKIIGGNSKQAINCRSLPDSSQALCVVASKHHRNEGTDTFIAALEARWPHMSMRAIGSSLKFCLLAEGQADVYPRFAPTCEWDTAAAQAVLEAAGGRVYRSDHAPLDYNSKDSMLNPFFYAVADPKYPWQDLLG